MYTSANQLHVLTIIIDLHVSFFVFIFRNKNIVPCFSDIFFLLSFAIISVVLNHYFEVECIGIEC